MDKDDEERQRKMIEQQIARAMASKGEVSLSVRLQPTCLPVPFILQEEETPVYTELQRASEEEKGKYTNSNFKA